MTQAKLDDLEAIRTVVDALKDFPPEDQQRIFRWSAEKLGLSSTIGSQAPAPVAPGQEHSQGHPQTHHASHHPKPGPGVDIKSFIDAKKPRNDVQFAAAVAFYYRFEAPPATRKIRSIKMIYKKPHGALAASDSPARSSR